MMARKRHPALVSIDSAVADAQSSLAALRAEQAAWRRMVRALRCAGVRDPDEVEEGDLGSINHGGQVLVWCDAVSLSVSHHSGQVLICGDSDVRVSHQITFWRITDGDGGEWILPTAEAAAKIKELVP